jgi:hypothetical protein
MRRRTDAINPSPFQLADYKWPRTLFIIDYVYFKFKILFFDINSTLSQINIIAFHCLGRAIRCLRGNFWILTAPRSLEFWSLRAVIKFSSGTEDQTRLQESVKKLGQKLVMFSCEWELCKRHYDVASFRLPCERWNGIYESAPGRTRDFESPTWEYASHLHTSHTSSRCWSVRTWSLHAPKSSSLNRFTEVDYQFK